MFWSLLWSSSPLVLPLRLPNLAVVALIFVSYLAGHLAQALSNVVEKWSRAVKALDEKIPVSADLQHRVQEIIHKRFGVEPSKVSGNELFLLCDQALVHTGSVGERDIFIYREGFYRGNCLALALLSIAFLTRTIHSPSLLVIGRQAIEMHRGLPVIAAICAGFGSWLAYKRYLRFRENKYKTCYARFLSLCANWSDPE